jgi:hypothetical protein
MPATSPPTNARGRVQAALNQKMADFTANAKQFTMDGGIVYDFKDEDDYKTAKKDLSHLKKAMASNWVEQPRQRKARPAATRLPQLPVLVAGRLARAHERANV